MESNYQETIEALIEALASLESTVRDDAQIKLLALKSAAVEPLIAAMSGNRGRVSWEAAVILAQIEDSRWIMPMLDSLSSSNPILGQVAVQALERLGREHVNTIIATLPMCHHMVQLHIVGMLGRLGEKQAVLPLMDLLESTDSPSLRCEIVQSLGMIGDSQAVNLIQLFQGDEDHHVRKRVRIALERLCQPNSISDDSVVNINQGV